MRPFSCISETPTKIIMVIAIVIVACVLLSECTRVRSAYASVTTKLSIQAHKNWSNVTEYDAFEIPLNKANDSSSTLRLICIKKKNETYGAIYVLDNKHPYLQPLFEPDSFRLRMQKCQ